jgi:hypothetical protein
MAPLNAKNPVSRSGLGGQSPLRKEALQRNPREDSLTTNLSSDSRRLVSIRGSFSSLLVAATPRGGHPI